MAHFLVVEVPGGGYALLDQLIDDGHSFTFVTQDLNTYLRVRNFTESPLSRAREIVVVNPFSFDTFRRKILAMHEANAIDGILCSIDYRLPDVSRVAAELGLPFLNQQTCHLLREKHAVRHALENAPVRQPSFVLAEDRSQLPAIVEALGYPVVIKPNDGYASVDVHLIRNAQQLEAALEALPERTHYGLGEFGSGKYLVERLIDGPVVSCEVMVVGGKYHLLGVTDRIEPMPGSPVEFGGCFPSTRFSAQPIYDAAVAALDAVHYDHGAAHIEFIVARDGVYLVEINARLIGGALPKLLSLALGRPVYRDLISLALSKTARLPERRYEGISCIRWICTDRRGTLKAMRAREALPPQVKVMDYNLRPGSKVQPPRSNGDRIGYVMTLTDDQATAERTAAEAVSRIDIDIEEEAE